MTIPLGARLTQTFEYYPWNTQGGRLHTLTATGGTQLQNLSYAYDTPGNINSINDSVTGETQTFTYDALNRLTSASVTNGLAPYSEGYGYDTTTGNLASKAGVSYTYDPAHKHAVASLSNGNSYSYDANGNQTTRYINSQTYTLGYDAENHLVNVTGPSFSASFVYSGDGQRVKSTINRVSTTFVGNHFEIANGVVTKYYFAGSSRIAMRIGTRYVSYQSQLRIRLKTSMYCSQSKTNGPSLE